MVAEHMLLTILIMVMHVIYHIVVIMVVADCGQMIYQLELAYFSLVVMGMLHMNRHWWSVIIVDTKRFESTDRVLS